MINAMIQIEEADAYFLVPDRSKKMIYCGNREVLALVLADSKPDDIIATMGTPARCVVQTSYTEAEIQDRLNKAEKTADALNKLTQKDKQ